VGREGEFWGAKRPTLAAAAAAAAAAAVEVGHWASASPSAQIESSWRPDGRMGSIEQTADRSTARQSGGQDQRRLAN